MINQFVVLGTVMCMQVNFSDIAMPDFWQIYNVDYVACLFIGANLYSFILGQVGWGSEEPGSVENISAHGKGLELGDF